MIKIRIDGDYRECLAACEKIRRTAGMRIHIQSKFYMNRDNDSGRIYLEIELTSLYAD